VVFDARLIDIARRIGPTVGVGVRESHVANTHSVVVAQEAGESSMACPPSMGSKPAICAGDERVRYLRR
jgi:hypothetical protein